jgi:hypothetical protein
MATTEKRQGPDGRKGAGARKAVPGKIAETETKGSSDLRQSVGNAGRTGSFDEQTIQERAYAIWIEEGQPEGRDLEHWLRARGELERDAA